MRLILLAVGRCRAGPESDLCARYLGRADALGRSLGISPVEMREFDESRAGDAASRKAAEAKVILGALPQRGRFIVFDESGVCLSSRDFAAALASARDQGVGALAVVVGGADGLDAQLRAGAAAVVSLGRMTFPHQLVRVMLAEQLYRAVTILAGHPYHRE